MSASVGMRLRLDRRGHITRRGFLAASGAGLAGFGLLRARAAEMKKEGKACILLWMAGGPSQYESLDPKPGAPTQGVTKAIDTALSGLRFAAHWPKAAGIARELAVIRSMTGREGNHGRATYLLHTSYPPSGGIVHPGIGSIVSSELGNPDAELPNFVAIAGPSVGSSFLGVKHAPYLITEPTRPADNLALPVSGARLERRLELMRELEAPLAQTSAAPLVRDHQSIYQQTARMVLSPKTQAFDLEREPEKVRARYGPSSFGQGCLMARRLIEAGVPFVEVQSSGWDTHASELPTLTKLIPPVDQAWAALVQDLKARGMLERTLVIWMGEFGRTPLVNLRAGRDHYPQAFSVALAGGGVAGGRVIGATDREGVEVKDRPTSVADLFCTFYQALGIDYRKENDSNVGRPLAIVERGAPVQEVF